MPKNLTGQQAGTVHGDAVNDPSVRVIKGKNQFPQSFKHPSSCRYGEVDPVAAMKCERGDTFPYKFVTDLNTFTMASPMKSEVNMYTACFKVPMQAIYPRNWELMLPIPNKGDDVPETTRALFDPIRFVHKLFNSGYNDSVSTWIRKVLLAELVLSSGSLFAKFNMHFDALRINYRRLDNQVSLFHSFDHFFDTAFAPLLEEIFQFQMDNMEDIGWSINSIPSLLTDRQYFRVTFDETIIGNSFIAEGSYRGYYISFRRALELLRTGCYQVRSTLLDEEFGNRISNISLPITEFETVNIEPIISYQLCCAHFFSNSKVDFIYTAQLWRDNMEMLALTDGVTDDGLYIPTYQWNGLLKPFDVMSEYYFNNLLTDSGLYDGTSSTFNYRTSFFFNLFSFQRSLRFADYFTGARPEPLAVGDIDAPVIDGSVNALTMARRLQVTRLLNKVNISGPRIEDYLRALFGGRVPEAPKDVPVRLSVEKFNVQGFETNNTGDIQFDPNNPNITTSQLRLTDSRFMFEAEIEEPCWIIAVQYFEAERIYSHTMDRFAFHKNRYHDFIPDMQFTGDQPVYERELDVASGRSDMPFAYNLRYMEYKNRYSYSSGLFSNYLKSWALVTDNQYGSNPTEHIDPDYIRSSPSEFDRFYKSLTGYSLGTYAHFITFNLNVAEPFRQMVYAPEILA